MAAALLCAVALAALVVVVEATGRTTAPDRSVQHILLMHRVGWATRTLRVYTWLGSSVVLIPMVAAAAIWRVARGRAAGPRLDPASAPGIGRRFEPGEGALIGAACLMALAGSIVSNDLVKAVVDRPRPPFAQMLVHVTSSSFPSGHAADAAAVFGVLAMLLAEGRSRRVRAASWSATAIVVAVVGASRLYLGAHWLTDVLAGFALGGLWASGAAVVLTMARRRSAAPSGREPS